MVTATYTVGDAVTQAFRTAAITSKDSTVEDDDIAYAIVVLNRMLKDWQKRESLQWTFSYMNHTLTDTQEEAQEVSFPRRPIRLHDVNFRVGGIDRPMQRITRDEYNMLPQKLSRGDPTLWYWSQQVEEPILYIWPVPTVWTGKTLRISYERELPDLTATTDALDVPGEVWDTVVLNLADRLADDYEVPNMPLKARAQQAWDDMLAGQNEGSVYFLPQDY